MNSQSNPTAALMLHKSDLPLFNGPRVPSCALYGKIARLQHASAPFSLARPPRNERQFTKRPRRHSIFPNGPSARL